MRAIKFILWCLGGVALAILVVVVFLVRFWDNTPDAEVIHDFESNRTAFQEVAEFMVRSESPKEIRADDYGADDDNLRTIFKALGYRAVNRSDHPMVWFIRTSQLGFQQGIVWSPTGAPPGSVYLVSLVAIDENWFLFKMGQ